jgi:plasmid replication initiation protein
MTGDIAIVKTLPARLTVQCEGAPAPAPAPAPEASPSDDPTPVPRQDTIATASACGLPKARTPTRSRRVSLRLLRLLTIQTFDSLMY